MVQNIRQDFDGDSSMQAFLDKLEAAKAQTKTLTRQAEENRQKLQRAEAETAEAAKDLANQEAALSHACQSLENIEREQSKQQEWLAELEKINKIKSVSLAAAQKELEEACLRYNNAKEQADAMEAQIVRFHKQIEEQTNQIQQAYRLWQDNYNATQAAKQQTEESMAALSRMEATINQLLETREDSNHRVADAIAEKVLQSYDQHLSIQDMPLEELPKATVGAAVIQSLDEVSSQALQAASPSLPKNDSLAAVIAESLKISEPPDSHPEDTPEALAIAAEVQQAAAILHAGKAEEEQPLPQPQPDNGQEASEPAPLSDEVFWDEKAARKLKKQEQKAQRKQEKLPEAAAAAPPPEQEADSDIWEEPQPSKTKSPLWSYVICVVVALALAFVIKQYVFQITQISGESMEPTLMPDDRVFTYSLSYTFGQPQRGDIVVFPAPDQVNKEAYYVKRVIALPGEHLVISNGIVTIDDGLLNEDYLGDTETLGEIDTIVPEGKIFVMGDNRLLSHDSRSESVSFIDIETIMSKAVWRLYPFDRMGSLYDTE